jgi:hypothetical protein
MTLAEEVADQPPVVVGQLPVQEVWVDSHEALHVSSVHFATQLVLAVSQSAMQVSPVRPV